MIKVAFRLFITGLVVFTFVQETVAKDKTYPTIPGDIKIESIVQPDSIPSHKKGASKKGNENDPDLIKEVPKSRRQPKPIAIDGTPNVKPIKIKPVKAPKPIKIKAHISL